MEITNFCVALKMNSYFLNGQNDVFSAWEEICRITPAELAAGCNLFYKRLPAGDGNPENAVLCGFTVKTFHAMKPVADFLTKNPFLRSRMTVFRPWMLQNEAKESKDYVFLGSVSDNGSISGGECDDIQGLVFSGKNIQYKQQERIVVYGSIGADEKENIYERMKSANENQPDAYIIPCPVPQNGQEAAEYAGILSSSRIRSFEDNFVYLTPDRAVIISLKSEERLKEMIEKTYLLGYRTFRIGAAFDIKSAAFGQLTENLVQQYPDAVIRVPEKQRCMKSYYPYIPIEKEIQAGKTAAGMPDCYERCF